MLLGPWSSRNQKRRRPRKKFEPEEDDLLSNLVSQFGEDWDAVSNHLPGRNARQVRDRWKSYLSPDINKDPFTDAEDDLLNQKLKEIGPKWVNMTVFFNNRTDAALKNRWQYLSRRLESGKPIVYNKQKKEQKKVSVQAQSQQVTEQDQIPKQKSAFSINPDDMLEFWREIYGEMPVSNYGTIKYDENFLLF